MTKQEVKQALRGAMIAVIRCNELQTAQAVCTAAVDAGIDALEITFSVSDAPHLIRTLKEQMPGTVIGAGTVFSREQAQQAHAAGADFLVSPCVVEEVADYCRAHNLFCSLGAATPTEAYTAYRLGCDVVKLFPGECISPKIIKACKAPMPFMEFMPTGGVDDKSIRTWFDAGAYAVGLGGYLTGGVDESNLYLLKERVQALRAARG